MPLLMVSTSEETKAAEILIISEKNISTPPQHPTLPPSLSPCPCITSALSLSLPPLSLPLSLFRSLKAGAFSCLSSAPFSLLWRCRGLSC